MSRTVIIHRKPTEMHDCNEVVQEILRGIQLLLELLRTEKLPGNFISSLRVQCVRGQRDDVFWCQISFFNRTTGLPCIVQPPPENHFPLYVPEGENIEGFFVWLYSEVQLFAYTMAPGRIATHPTREDRVTKDMNDFTGALTFTLDFPVTKPEIFINEDDPTKVIASWTKF